MDVFLVPVRPAGGQQGSRFALYCEPPPEPIDPEVDGEVPKRGLFARWGRKFREALAEGEAEQRRQEAGQPEQPGGGVGRFVKRKLAEAVAEHRLLWTLRRKDRARLLHPDTVPGPEALEWALHEFRRDFGKHRLWCVVDGLIVIVSAPLALVPGPNFLAYYFMFRSVGHYFSLLGARRGMARDTWTVTPSSELSSVEAALGLPATERDRQVDAAATALGLERLTAFVRRVAPGRTARP